MLQNWPAKGAAAMPQLGKWEAAALAAGSRTRPSQLPCGDLEATSRAAGSRDIPYLQEPHQQGGSLAGVLSFCFPDVYKHIKYQILCHPQSPGCRGVEIVFFSFLILVLQESAQGRCWRGYWVKQSVVSILLKKTK